MNTASQFRLEVAPLTLIPLGRSPLFSYFSKTSVPRGSVVSISFGKQHLEGIVFDCQLLPGKRPYWMKEISEVKYEAFLTEQQIELAQAVSAEYFTPLGRVLNHFLPKVAKARKKKETSTNEEKSLLRPNKEELLLLKKVSLSLPETPLYIDTSHFGDTRKLLALLAKKLSSKGQVLILVPEITLIFSLESLLQQFLPQEERVVLHSLLSDGPFFEAWEKIRSGKAKIILGTRQSLFAPYKNLSAILFTEEQDESYKQWDMSPRYHAKRVGEILAHLFRAKLFFLSNTPSVESLWQIEQKKYQPIVPIQNHPPLEIGLINLRLERYRKNFSPFSEELSERIRTVLGARGQVLLYINRQGMNVFSVCESCKNVFRCKECGRPLTSTKEGNFRCLSCSYKTSSFPNCPSCGGLQFKHVGFGTEKIEKEAQKLFPHAHIARLDGSVLRAVKDTRKVFEKGEAGKIDILIGTQMILKDPPLPNLSLIAMIDADSLLFFPDFKADERLYHHFLRATLQIQHRQKKSSFGGVFAQTFHPESPFFQRSAKEESIPFLKQVLADRTELFYPPLSRLMSLTIQEKSKEEAEKKTNDLASSLQKIAPKNFRIHPPQTIQFQKRKNIFESTLLIRIPASMMYPDTFISFLHRISKDCIIDVDPISFH